MDEKKEQQEDAEGHGRWVPGVSAEGTEEDTEGNMPFSRVSPEGTEEDAEGQAKRRVSAEDTEEDTEGNMPKKRVSPEGTEEDDTEGQSRRP